MGWWGGEWRAKSFSCQTLKVLQHLFQKVFQKCLIGALWSLNGSFKSLLQVRFKSVLRMSHGCLKGSLMGIL